MAFNVILVMAAEVSSVNGGLELFLPTEEICHNDTSVIFSCTSTGDHTWRFGDQIVAEYTDLTPDPIIGRSDLNAITVSLSKTDGVRQSLLIFSQPPVGDFVISCNGQILPDAEGTGTVRNLVAMATSHTEGKHLLRVSWDASRGSARYNIHINGQLIKQTLTTEELVLVDADSNMTVTVTPMSTCNTSGESVSIQAEKISSETPRATTTTTTAVPTTTEVKDSEGSCVPIIALTVFFGLTTLFSTTLAVVFGVLLYKAYEKKKVQLKLVMKVQEERDGSQQKEKNFKTKHP